MLSSAKMELDKRQTTVQLTIYVDGEHRVKPLVIFWGAGSTTIMVQFQKNAWCDEQLFLFWATHMWGRNVDTRKLLIVDNHRTHATD